jgi:pimeloyl-ACP methyl ester carboxylesterase
LVNPDIPLTGRVEKLLVMNAALRCFAGEIEPLRARVPDAALRRLAHRLGRERAAGEAWDAALQYGAPLGTVEQLLDFWCDELEPAALEARLGELPLFRTLLHGRSLCFAHARSSKAGVMPLLWLHGYCGSVLETAQLLATLTREFHVVVPSLPGFGLSDTLPEPSLASVAEACAALMASLGYQRYAVHGSDLGAGIASELARLAAPHVAALHVTSLAALPCAEPFELSSLSTGEKSQLASLSELRATWRHAAPESAVERLAVAACQLADSDSALQLGELRELLLCGLSLSLLGQQDFQRSLAEQAQAPCAVRSEVPVCVCSFPLAAPSLRRFAERTHRVVDWQEQERGGELAALEQPQLLLSSLCAWLSRCA